jgi:inhibitor of cysteine peptidase
MRSSLNDATEVFMIRTKTVLLILVFGCLLAMACSGETGESADSVVYTDTADAIQVEVGEQFQISLESNPSTGHKWQFMSPVDSTLLSLVESRYIPKPNPEKFVGRGGNEQWLFEALAKGSTSVSMRYLQPWDSTSVARTVEFQIEIKQK